MKHKYQFWFGLGVFIVLLFLQNPTHVAAQEQDWWPTKLFDSKFMTNATLEQVKQELAKGEAKEIVALREPEFRDNCTYDCQTLQRTPLTVAAHEQYFNPENSALLDIVELYIELGADINAANRHGFSAVYTNNWEMLNLLLKSGANPNHRSEGGKTPLMNASTPRNIDLLIKYGADINAKNKLNRTALWLEVSWFGFSHRPHSPHIIAGVETLLKHGADPNIADYRGMTPLMLSAQSRATEAVEMLIEAGADIHLSDHEGKTALQYARQAKKNNTAMIELLLAHGAIE